MDCTPADKLGVGEQVALLSIEFLISAMPFTAYGAVENQQAPRAN